MKNGHFYLAEFNLLEKSFKLLLFNKKKMVDKNQTQLATNLMLKQFIADN